MCVHEELDIVLTSRVPLSKHAECCLTPDVPDYRVHHKVVTDGQTTWQHDVCQRMASEA